MVLTSNCKREGQTAFEFKDFYVLYYFFIRTMNRLILSLLIMASLTLGLHEELHQLEAHALTDEEYNKELILRQNTLIDAMAKVRLQSNSMSAKIKTDGSVAATETASLKSLLDSERDALNKVEDYIKVPLTPKPCNSSVQTTKARDSLLNESKEMNASVQGLKKELAACTKCAISTDLNNCILQQENYISVTNEICSSNCTNAPAPLELQTPSGLVDLSQSQYKNNLDAKNWVYGNITEDQYKYQVFSDSIKYNQTSCPIDKPYVSPVTSNCFQCPDGLNFSLGEKTCKGCPNDFVYNVSTNTCDSPCNSTEIYNTTSKKCDPKPVHPTDSICPIAKPIWNADTKSCEVCPASTPLYNKTTAKCEACPTNSTWNQTSMECVMSCPPGQSYDPNTKKCVTPTCAEGTSWNNATLKCEVVCPNGTKFNNVTKQCEKVTAQQCDDIKPIWNQTALQCQICPEQTPVWNKTEKKCEPCPAEIPVYDYSQLKCVDKICDTGLQWNRVLKKCSPLVGNCTKEQVYVFDNQTCVSKCQVNHTYIKQNDTCSCFPDKPAFNNKTRLCQAPPCPAGQKWNTNLLKCTVQNMNCTDKSQAYNFTAGQCMSRCEPGVAYIESNDTCNCPPEMPTFNKTTRRCEEGICKTGQFWNKVLKKCSPLTGNCSAWQVYDSATEKCINKCEVNHTYIKDNDTCQCTAEYPRFDVETRTCQKPICPVGYIWNKELIKCSEVNKTCHSWETYDFKTENCLVKCEVNQTYFEKYDNCTCPPERPLYNAVTKNCTEPVCPKDYKFNPNLISCISQTGRCDPSQVYNFTSGLCIQKCEANQTYIKANDTCTCPLDRPFFNTTSKICTIPPCPTNSKWNQKLRRCVLLDSNCLAWQTWSFDEAKCIDKCAVNYTYFKSTDTCSCPPETPEFDNKTKKCVEPSCPTDFLWNKVLIKCSEVKKNCSAWQTYNFVTENCDVRCEVNVTYDRRDDTCNCPPQKPHFDNTTRKCLIPNCTDGFKFNPALVKCSSILGNCSSWEMYDFTTEKCISKCEVNHTYIKEDDSCSCTAEKPLFDNKTRTCAEPVCPNGTKWNAELVKCSPLEKACEKWQVYNFATEQCLDKCQVNHTYFKGDDTCQCFPEAPHFDNKTRKCVIPPCANGTQWNTNLKKCSPLEKNCSSWQLYNFTTQNCDAKCKVNQLYHPSTQTCQCSPEFPIYDAKTEQCVEPQCPAGYKWNKYLIKCSALTQSCQKNEFYDFASEKCQVRCEVDHTYYQQNDTCECFPQKPLFNTTTRLCQLPTCQDNTQWNPHLKKCSSLNGVCQRWQVYNFTNETCINKCDQYQTYYAINDTCSCYPADPIFNKVTRKCEEPICLFGQYWDRVHAWCRCKEGLVLNTTSKSCQVVCPSGQYLNFATNSCVVSAPICGANMFVNASNICQCLPGYIYEDGGVSCRINCIERYRYNPTTKMCEQITCPAGFSFNAATQRCEKVEMCPAGFFYVSSTNKCISCPAGFVYNSARNLCQASTNNVCPQGYTFNPVNKLCDPDTQNCQAGFYYDQVSRQCLPLYITSPQAANLISTNMTAYNEYYTNQKKINIRLTDCALPKPYFDKISSACVSCPADHPYFNLDLNKCESCGTQTYNANTYRCIDNVVVKHYNIDPTIGRFMANVI